jgi:tetratricopeptide (TPR) repeat protein
VRLRADFAQARHALARVYADLGMKEEAFREQSLVMELAETQVGFLLSEAWGHMARTAWKSAASVLARAAKADPSDARVPAYLAVVRLADGRAPEAAALQRMALAMEEARARVGGTTFGRGGTGRRSPDDFALAMVLRLKLAEPMIAADPAGALELMADNLALTQRVGATEWLADLPTSMLPPVEPDPDRRPEAENFAALAAWSHFYAGRCLAALRRTAEAERELRAALDTGRDITVGIGQRAMQEPRNRAGLALARMLIESGRRDEAGHVLIKTDVTIRDRHAREFTDEKRRLQQMLNR